MLRQVAVIIQYGLQCIVQNTGYDLKTVGVVLDIIVRNYMPECLRSESESF